MKDFLKYTLATVVGIFLAGIVFTILGIISLIGMVATSDTETKVKENSIFELRLDGTIEERSQAEDPFSKLLGATSTTTYGLDDILSSIKKAKSNDNIKGIYIEGGVTGGSSFASCEAI